MTQHMLSNEQFEEPSWLPIGAFPDYGMVGNQDPNSGSPVEEVQWNYIRSLEERVNFLERELALSHTQLGFRYSHKSSSASDATTERTTPETSYPISSSGHHNSEDDSPSPSGRPTKRRKYVRKPRPDTSAPVKPLTAYASFANDMRKQYQDKGLSFSDLAKQIGHDWQSCPINLRELYLSNAMAEKEIFEQELSKYKNTESYKRYQEYAREFKDNQRQKKSGPPTP